MSAANKHANNRFGTDYDYLVKLILVGDSGVGKTCLLKRYSDGIFPEHYMTTIGVDFDIRTIDVKGKVAKLQIWDTAGQERFRNICSSYYRNAHAVMMVFDITKRESFNSIRSQWLSDMQLYAGDDVQMILVANKSDQQRHRQVTEDEIAELEKELGTVCIRTSALTNTGVEEAFRTCTIKYIEHRTTSLIDEKEPVSVLTETQTVSQKCPSCTIL